MSYYRRWGKKLVEKGNFMDRRQVLRGIGLGSAMALAAPALVGLDQREAHADLRTGPSAGPYMQDMGAGMYWDTSTAGQLSTWCIQPTLVQCAVGTLGAAGFSGPFAMLMYSVRIDDYDIDRPARMLTASGRMRSITIMGMLVEEDVEHDFVAVAVDHRGVAPDRYETHFVTPMWNTGNPMATPSTLRPGWVKFGGNVAQSLNGVRLGGVNVADA